MNHDFLNNSGCTLDIYWSRGSKLQ